MDLNDGGNTLLCSPHTVIIQRERVILTLGAGVSAAPWRTGSCGLCNRREGIWYNIQFFFAVLNDEVKPQESDKPANETAVGLA